MTADDLQQEIEQTRQQLGQTIDELAAKADVKARAKARVAEVSGQISHSEAVQRRWPVVVTAAGLALAASAVVWRRTHP
jgi:Protein of unknown function (DUF3618)